MGATIKRRDLIIDNNTVSIAIENNQPLIAPDYFWMADLSFDINRILDSIDEKERIIIQLLYGLNCDAVEMDDLSKRTHIPRYRIRQLKERAIRTIRKNKKTYNLLCKYLDGYETYG